MEELSSAHKIFWPNLVQNLMKPPLQWCSRLKFASQRGIYIVPICLSSDIVDDLVGILAQF